MPGKDLIQRGTRQNKFLAQIAGARNSRVTFRAACDHIEAHHAAILHTDLAEELVPFSPVRSLR